MIYEYKTAKGQPRKWVLQQFVISGLRRMSYKTPMRADALRAARMERGKYKCAKCQNIYGKRQICVDHIEPVLPISVGFTTWDSYIQRLFCHSAGLQVLCKKCHNAKSKEENKDRRKNYQKRKKKDDGART
jgi:hypothetical protein